MAARIDGIRVIASCDCADIRVRVHASIQPNGIGLDVSAFSGIKVSEVVLM